MSQSRCCRLSGEADCHDAPWRGSSSCARIVIGHAMPGRLYTASMGGNEQLPDLDLDFDLDDISQYRSISGWREAYGQ